MKSVGFKSYTCSWAVHILWYCLPAHILHCVHVTDRYSLVPRLKMATSPNCWFLTNPGNTLKSHSTTYLFSWMPMFTHGGANWHRGHFGSQRKRRTLHTWGRVWNPNRAAKYLMGKTYRLIFKVKHCKLAHHCKKGFVILAMVALTRIAAVDMVFNWICYKGWEVYLDLRLLLYPAKGIFSFGLKGCNVSVVLVQGFPGLLVLSLINTHNFVLV